MSEDAVVLIICTIIGIVSMWFYKISSVIVLKLIPELASLTLFEALFSGFFVRWAVITWGSPMLIIIGLIIFLGVFLRYLVAS